MKFVARSTAVAVTLFGLLLSLTSIADAGLLKRVKVDSEELPSAAGPALFGAPAPLAGPALAGTGPMLPNIMPGPMPYTANYGSAVTVAAPGACCTPACPNPCIKYRNAIFDCKVKCCDPCQPPLQAVLHVQNPCTCCPLDVPVCLPNCCCGEPKIDCRKALFGEGVVTYTWCCGFSASIRFKKCGDVLVTYRGN